MTKKRSFATNAVQGTYSPDKTGARVLPIYQTASYDLDNSTNAAELFNLEKFGNIYSRIMNPTSDELEKKVALLEGGVGALSTSSGHAAILLAVLNICQSGDNLIASSTLYGGTYNLFNNTFAKLGISVSFVDPDASKESILALADDRTRLVFGETIGNPSMNPLDFEKFSAISKKLDVPLIIDNTFATPYLCRPFEHGANIVIHSATKYLGGHGSSLAGIIVDGGNFDWNNGKYPEITEPDPSYHDIKYFESFGNAAYIIKARVQMLRDYGPCLSPFNSFLINQGIETLHLRMKAHSENALLLAEFLEKHPRVDWVSYSSLESSKHKDLQLKYFPLGASGMFTFGVKGGLEAGKKFINSVEVATIVANVGDVRTMVIHPGSTTHSQLTEEEQISAGVLPDLIRVSVGIEAVEDIIADFDQALNSI